MPTVRQLKLFLFFAKIIILLCYFGNQRFMSPANWGIWGADIHNMDTSVPWDETKLQHGYDFENRKIFDYYRKMKSMLKPRLRKHGWN